jgi:hypothetical protein
LNLVTLQGHKYLSLQLGSCNIGGAIQPFGVNQLSLPGGPLCIRSIHLGCATDNVGSSSVGKHHWHWQWTRPALATMVLGIGATPAELTVASWNRFLQSGYFSSYKCRMLGLSVLTMMMYYLESAVATPAKAKNATQRTRSLASTPLLLTLLIEEQGCAQKIKVRISLLIIKFWFHSCTFPRSEFGLDPAWEDDAQYSP